MDECIFDMSGQRPASVTYAPPMGKRAAITKVQIARTWPNVRIPPTAVFDEENNTK
jgi:hypothetical protein